MSKINTTAMAFRKLREVWFWRHLASHSHEREWEDEKRQKLRESQNEDTKQLFDKQTEMILSGHDVPERWLAPTCGYDMRDNDV